MRKFMIAAVLSLSAFFYTAYGQTGTASVYTVFSPMYETTTYLIDTVGNTVHQWNMSTTPALTAYLLEDSRLLRPYRVSNPTMNGGGVGGGIQLINWDGSVSWNYTWANSSYQQHHEAAPMKMANGDYHVLIISWERKTNVEAIQAGRQNITSEMWPDAIFELEPVGTNQANVIWEWHLWDHLCQDVDTTKDNYYPSCADHPELLNINKGSVGGFGGGGDWSHCNGIDYDPINDQIVFSSHELDEFYIIDHSTTTAEAATHSGGNSGQGGDLLYRWGNPENYGGSSFNHILWVCHNANVIDSGYPGAGNIMIFNNGDRTGSANDYSSVEEITPPRSGYNFTSPWTQSQTWTYMDPGNFYSNHLAGAWRLKNGNTLATEGTSAHIIEITTSGQIVFDYQVSGFNAQLAKAVAYEKDYPGLIEITAREVADHDVAVNTWPNPATDLLRVSAPGLNGEYTSFRVTDLSGKTVWSNEVQLNGTMEINLQDYPSGMYILSLESGDIQKHIRFVKNN